MKNQLKRIEIGQLSNKWLMLYNCQSMHPPGQNLRVVSIGLLPGCSQHGLSRLLLM